MPLPLFLLKLYWVGKVLKFPFAALVGTFREYRGRDVQREDAGALNVPHSPAPAIHRLRYRERTFLQHPWRALRDRRFWIRGVTNFAEVGLHILSLWAWPRNVFLRRSTAAFVVWRPHRTHEHRLFEDVEYGSWGRVFARSWRWVWEGLYVWHGPPRATLGVGRHGWHANWREIHFDGADIAVYVGPRRWRRPLYEFRRKGGARVLRVQSVGPLRARATLLGDGAEVLQTVTLGPSGE
jgi:hypothetical protein